MLVVPVVQLGAVLVQAPQSRTVSCIWPSSGDEPVGLAVLRTKSPASEPVFVMSTVELPVSPGFMPLMLSSAVLGELAMTRVPVLKALPGLAADAVKFAPEPTVMPTAARMTARAPRVRRGCAARRCRRVTGGSSRETDRERPGRGGGGREPGCLVTVSAS